MTKSLTITNEEMDWLEDAISVYTWNKESPESGEIVAYLLKRTLESATHNNNGYTLHPITLVERTMVLDILDEWRELEVESD